MLQQPAIIWEQFNAELKRFICQKVKQDNHCDDILQEVYLKVYVNIRKIQSADNVRAYLYRVASNAVIDYYRNVLKDRCVEEGPEVGS